MRPCCERGFTHVVPPVHWPIETVALACITCGHILEYVDNLLILSPREAISGFQKRPWVVSHRTAREFSGLEHGDQVVLMGKDLGLSEAEIADILYETQRESEAATV